MHEIKITLLYGGALAYFFVIMSGFVILRRRKKKIRFFGGDDSEMQAAMRAQGNFAEYTPIFLILMLALEYNDFSHLLLHLAGIGFCLGRLSHSYSLLFHEKNGDYKFRIAGMALTFIPMGALAKFCAFAFFF